MVRYVDVPSKLRTHACNCFHSAQQRSGACQSEDTAPSSLEEILALACVEYRIQRGESTSPAAGVHV